MALQDRVSEPPADEKLDVAETAPSSERASSETPGTDSSESSTEASSESGTAKEASSKEASSESGIAEGEGPTSHRLPLFRELDTKGQLLRSIVIVFTLFHLGAMLVGSAIPSVRNKFKPILGFYSDGLRMSNSWGMFGKPPNATHILIEVVMRDGTVHVMSTTNAVERSFYERIRDVRIRKVQAKLAEQSDRGRFGGVFLEYFCREATLRYGNDVRDVRARNLLHETRDDDNKVTRNASSTVVLSRRCSDPRVRIPPRRPVASPARDSVDVPNEGGDL